MKRVLPIGILAAVLVGGCQLLPFVGGTGGSPAPDANVTGRVVAGPTCPVERVPADPQCAPHPVASATLRITDAGGTAVAIVESDANGAFSLALPAGSYTLTAKPVSGLMGAPAPISFSVVGLLPVQLTVEYDTGIR